MSEKTNEILNSYFIQKKAASAGDVLKVVKGAVGKIKTGAGKALGATKGGTKKAVEAIKTGAKAADAAVVRGAEAASDKLARLSFKGLPADKYVTDSAPRLAAYRLSNHIFRNPRAYGYGAIGAGAAGLTAAGVGTAAALKGGDSVLANAAKLAKENPIATTAAGAATGALTAGALAYALAPEKSKKLATLIATLGGGALGGIGTHAALNA